MSGQVGTDDSSWSSPFDSVLPTAGAAGAQITPANPLIGTPDSDTSVWEGQQEHSDTCAIRCQEFIITQFTGQDPGEDSLVKEAQDHGWYNQGTSMTDTGNLLENHGIAVNRYEHANIFNLSNELAQGHKVIVGVHSNTLWHDHFDPLESLGFGGAADHAIVVSGIDTSDPTHVSVVVSDPGTGQPEARYPLEQFVKAWQGSDFFMVSTKDAPPEERHLPEMANFDYGLGHIGQVWGVPYHEFKSLGEHPEQWVHVLEGALTHLSSVLGDDEIGPTHISGGASGSTDHTDNDITPDVAHASTNPEHADHQHTGAIDPHQHYADITHDDSPDL